MTPDTDLMPDLVRPMGQTAKFYRDGELDLVEIGFVGSKDTVVHEVTPDLMARFRDEWVSYCDSVPLKIRAGTPLTDIPGMDGRLAEKYQLMQVHNAEELAVLSDGQCQALGHGTITLRNQAQGLLERRKLAEAEERIRKISKASENVAPMPAEADPRYASKEDVEEIKNQMGALAGMMAQLLEKKKPGRPKKED